jgi:hypothetical protein
MIDDKSTLLSVDEAAGYLNSPVTPCGPGYTRNAYPLSSWVLFRPEDLESFINSNAIQPENCNQKEGPPMQTELCS